MDSTKIGVRFFLTFVVLERGHLFGCSSKILEF